MNKYDKFWFQVMIATIGAFIGFTLTTILFVHDPITHVKIDNKSCVIEHVEKENVVYCER